MQAYMYKGTLFFKDKNYQKTLNTFILAAAAEKHNPNIAYRFSIKFNIGVLKRILGEYEDAEKLFLDCKTYEEQKEKMYVNRYINILFQLSSIYYETKKVTECTQMNKKGIQWSTEHKNEPMYYSFVMNEGINLNIKDEYKASIDSLEKAYPKLKKVNKPVVDLYLGKSYYAIGEEEKGLNYFKKIDTVFNNTNNLFPPLLTAYEYLIKDSKEKENTKLQLYYTEQFLKVKSVIEKDYKYLFKNISKKYDIPALMASREEAIAKLKNKNKLIIAISLLFCLLALGAVFYYYRLKKLYKKRYEAIMNQSSSMVEESIIIKDAMPQLVTTEIDETIIQEILEQLQLFEQGEQYLINKVSLKDVAKMINTNSKYLSKIINTHKNKNFTTYINDLRINYLINRLQIDPIYRKYTIRALAEEIGFSNPEGFSRAFQKKTGLKPSYFIKKIREDQENK
jgi:AraC-like DNA-binding protein